MKQLLKVCVTDDTRPGGSCRYVGLYESLRHRCFEIRVVDQPEGGEESATVQGTYDFSAQDYLNVHVTALFQYIRCVQAQREAGRQFQHEVSEAHVLSHPAP